MAIGWMTVLQLVPWSDVITNAPKVADAAKKLWHTVAKKPEKGDSLGTSAHTSGAVSLATLQSQVALLHEQMLASSELIKALADQNAQLISRVETGRRRSQRIAAVAGLALVLAATSLTLILTR